MTKHVRLIVLVLLAWGCTDENKLRTRLEGVRPPSIKGGPIAFALLTSLGGAVRQPSSTESLEDTGGHAKRVWG